LANANESALHIKPGCATPALPASAKRPSKLEQDLSPSHYIEGILKGDRSLLARAITLIESSRAKDWHIAEEIIEKCLPASGNSIRVGVTGIPGAGKSSLIEALGKYLIAESNEKVAVLAIDPSSQLSGGSILGDKTRMSFLASSDMAFIRPSPSRGTHGGVAQNTRDAILLCEAAGYRNIFVETVGVGQSEAAVGDMVDFFLLVTLAGAGDELQGIKRGVMEMADVVVVNKADSDNIRAAEIARTEAANALHLLPVSPSGWTPRAMACSAHTGHGVAELWSCILEYAAITRANGWFDRKRREQVRHSMHENIERGLLQLFRSDPLVQQRWSVLEQQVAAGQITSVRATRELLALFASRRTNEEPTK
jgi:LAO/AO transport system kinase